jgi:hypothetical protein
MISDQWLTRTGLHIVTRSRQAYTYLVVEALLVDLSYLDVATDLNTQCPSGQEQADTTLETGNRILTEITVSISRPQEASGGNCE